MVDGGCPVLRPDSPCPDQPLSASITVTRDADGSVVATARSAADGGYRIALAPGSYTLRARNLSNAVLPRGSDERVMVESDRFVTVVLRFDSGVRAPQPRS